MGHCQSISSGDRDSDAPPRPFFVAPKVWGAPFTLARELGQCKIASSDPQCISMGGNDNFSKPGGKHWRSSYNEIASHVVGTLKTVCPSG